MSKIIGIVIVVIIAVATGWFIYSDIKSSTPSEDAVLQQDNKIMTKNGIGLTLSDGDINDVEVKQISDNTIDNIAKQELIHPVLDRAIVFQDSFPEDARAIIRNNIAILTKQLKTDPTSFNNWLDLAIQYKIIEDYEGARDVWEFLNILFPGNSISFRNLADLYGYYLDNQQKAEENFLKAIEISPDEIEYYIKTMEFYRDVMKDNEKASQIIERGVNSNPASEELKSFLKNPNLQ